jgi:L-Ala-D/L-Glu epimerase
MTGPQPPLDRILAMHVQVPFRRPFATARGVVTGRDSWVVRLRDADGHEGFGEIALDPGASSESLAKLARLVRDAVELLARGRRPSELSRPITAGFEEAREQLEAFAEAGRLPDSGSSVAVNATVGAAGPKRSAETAGWAVAMGFTCLKLKVGAETTVELRERIAAVRSAVGPATQIRLDVNAAWDLAGAVERLTALADLDLEYVEQPLAPSDLAGHAALRRATVVPIGLDESADSEAAVARILAAGAADVLVVKPSRVGGPKVVRTIAAGAAAAGVPVVVSSFFETGIGLYGSLRAAAALPIVGRERAHGLATADLLVHDLLATPLRTSSGRMHLPDRLVVDEDALKRFTVEHIEKSG